MIASRTHRLTAFYPLLFLACTMTSCQSGAPATKPKGGIRFSGSVFVMTDYAKEFGGRIADTALSVRGTWVRSDTGPLERPHNTMLFECRREDRSLTDTPKGVCIAFYAYELSPTYVMTGTETYIVDRWSPSEIALKPTGSILNFYADDPCTIFRIRIDRDTREVTATGVYQKDEGCQENRREKLLRMGSQR